MHNKKKFILILAVVALVAALTTAGTVAYFTAEDRAHNTITSGGVEIELHEWADDERTEPFPEEGVTDVVPGTEVTKIVEVENVGASEAWVRVKFSKEIVLAEGIEAEPDPDLVQLDLNTEDWTEQDGWYYYNTPVAPGETVNPLFTTVSFVANMGNQYQEATVTIDIVAQAVQTANNGSSALEAAGWPQE